MSNQETVEKVAKGYRMNPPDNCPIEISELMMKCWAHKPDGRPSFSEIVKLLQKDSIEKIPQQSKVSGPYSPLYIVS